MRNLILSTIYSEFDKWRPAATFACSKGCSSCCTQNVTITALEGLNILEFCIEGGNELWLAEALSTTTPAPPPLQTTNEYIAACIAGRDCEQEHATGSSRCLFLHENICTIYPVRPFSCRCFVSQDHCQRQEAAIVSAYYLTASMAAMQIIEHLGQYEYWGKMGDVLLALCDMSRCKNIASALVDPSIIISARMRTRTAQPISGFLIPEEDDTAVSPLLEAIFTSRLGEKTIEQILNGR